MCTPWNGSSASRSASPVTIALAFLTSHDLFWMVLTLLVAIGAWRVRQLRRARLRRMQADEEAEEAGRLLPGPAPDIATGSDDIGPIDGAPAIATASLGVDLEDEPKKPTLH